MNVHIDGSWASAAVAFIAGAALFWAYVRFNKSSIQSSAIEALMAEITARKDEITRLKGELAEQASNHRHEVERMQGDMNGMRERIAQLEAHNATLADLLRGIPAWDKLYGSVEKLVQSADRLDDMLDKLPSRWQERQVEHLDLIEKIADNLGVERTPRGGNA